MMLRPLKHLFTPLEFNPGTNQLLGTKAKTNLDGTHPIEEILVFVDVTCGATGPTFLTGAALTAPNTVDNILGLVKELTLEVNDGIRDRIVAKGSGIGFLERASLIGLNLDRGTLSAIGLSQGASIAANQTFRIAYRIPICHPQIAEPLRTRCLLPCHTWKTAPKLTLEFENAANLYSAGSISNIQVSYQLLRRYMPDSVTSAILADGGFIESDIIETSYSVAPGTAGETKFVIPVPGSYTDICFRSYLGGASLSRATLDQVKTFGQETTWRIESGGQSFGNFRWNNLQTINDFSRTANSINQTYSPNFAGAIAALTSYQPPSSTALDFLTDGIGGGDAQSELGSVLDCNFPADRNLKMELIGNVANVATNASYLFMLGQRLYGDLSRWQAIK